MRRKASYDRAITADTTEGHGLGTWLGKEEVAEALGISVRSLERRVATGDFPRPVRIGRLLRWRRSSADAYLRQLEAAAQSP